MLSQIITIRNPRQLDELANETYLFAAIAAVVFIGVSWVAANLIKWEGGKDPKDAGQRRAAFFVIWFMAGAAFFLYNKFLVADKIAPNLQSKFSQTNYISTAIVFAVYLIVGFALSKLMRSSKYGTIFPSAKK